MIILLFFSRMLFEMLKELRKYIGCIYDLCNSIADLDLIFSFAQYSMNSGLTKPKFGQFMNIKNSRHPILDFISSVVLIPNDIVSFIGYKDTGVIELRGFFFVYF